MSSSEIIPFITKGYGLSDEDLNEITLRQKLRDISEHYSVGIRAIQNRLSTKLRMRILEFNESSGCSMESRFFFNNLINCNRHLFYSHLYSNRDCGVVLLYSGLKGKDNELFSCRLLPHEFTHHYQLVAERFPMLLPRGAPADLLPQFAVVNEFGPIEGDIYVDGLLLTEGRISFFKDFSERISDFVCEGILIGNGFTKGLLDEYSQIDLVSPAKEIPRNYPNYGPTVRYMNRLGLRDEAEWHALIKSTYGASFSNNVMQLNKKRILKLNKELLNRRQVFRTIFDISLKTCYTEFKELKKVVDYTKEVAHWLNIEVRTKKDW